MAKWANDAVMDAALDEIINNANQIHLCSQQPATRAEATTTYNLASESVTGGSFTKANGDTSGRKATVAAQTGISVTATGTGNHVAITDGTRLLYVTTCAGTAVSSGGTVDINAWDIEVGDPT